MGKYDILLILAVLTFISISTTSYSLTCDFNGTGIKLFSVAQMNNTHVAHSDYYSTNFSCDVTSATIRDYGTCLSNEKSWFSMWKENNTHIGHKNYYSGSGNKSLCVSPNYTCYVNTTGDCAPDETEIFSVNKTNNTHIAMIDYYGHAFCCKLTPTTVISIVLSDALSEGVMYGNVAADTVGNPAQNNTSGGGDSVQIARMATSSPWHFEANARVICRDNGYIHITWLNETVVQYARSSNDGVDWSITDLIDTTVTDEPVLGCDNSYIYIAWRGGDGILYVNISSDNGTSWMGKALNSKYLNAEHDIQALGNKVYITYNLLDGEEDIDFINSSDNLDTFTSTQIMDVAGSDFCDASVLSAEGIGDSSDKIYVLGNCGGSTDRPTNFTRSTDGGNTWTTPTRVNQIPLSQQYWSIASNGTNVFIAWAEGFMLYATKDIKFINSSDSGDTWSSATQVGTGRFASVSVDNEGNPIIFFSYNNTGGYYDIAYKRFNITSGTFGDLRILTTNANATDVKTTRKAKDNIIDIAYRNGTSDPYQIMYTSLNLEEKVTQYKVTVGATSTDPVDFYSTLNETISNVYINESSSTTSASSGFTTNTTIDTSWSILGNSTLNCTNVAVGGNCWMMFWMDVGKNVPSGTIERNYTLCGVKTGSSSSLCG